nr:hypothetical protein Itr_chr10CG16860 [Ipomoea trifida]
MVHTESESHPHVKQLLTAFFTFTIPVPPPTTSLSPNSPPAAPPWLSLLPIFLTSSSSLAFKSAADSCIIAAAIIESLDTGTSSLTFLCRIDLESH